MSKGISESNSVSSGIFKERYAKQLTPEAYDFIKKIDSDTAVSLLILRNF